MSSKNEEVSLRYINKKRRVKNAEEEMEIKRRKEYEQNLEEKKLLINKEFEKNQKQILINVSDRSKLNEAKLIKEIDELVSINENKARHLISLNDQLVNAEFAYDVAASYTKIQNLRGDDIAMEDENNTNNNPINHIFYTSQISIELIKKLECSHFTLTEIIKADYLAERLKVLKESLFKVEKQIETEKQITSCIDNKLSQMIKDNNLLNKLNLKLKMMNEHAEKRFHDLEAIELTAKNKCQATKDDLNRNKRVLKDFKTKEKNFLQAQKYSAESQSSKLNNLKDSMSKILIAIEENKKKNGEYQEKLQELDRYHEVMLNKRATSKLVSSYIDILQELQKTFLDVPEEDPIIIDPARLSMQNSLLNGIKKSSTASIKRRGTSIFVPIAGNRIVATSCDSPRLRAKTLLETSHDSVLTKSQFRNTPSREKHHIVYKINQFYSDHPDGPGDFVDIIIKKYRELIIQYGSMKNIYDDMACQKLKKEEMLKQLNEELDELKQKNQLNPEMDFDEEDLNDLYDGKEAIDSGIIALNNMVSTINQAEIDIQNINDSNSLLASTEAFIFSIYFDFIELLIRFSKYIQAISEQSGGLVTTDLEKLCKDVLNFTNEFSTGKRIRDKTNKQNENLTQTNGTISCASEKSSQFIQANQIEIFEIIHILTQACNEWDKIKSTEAKHEKFFKHFAERFCGIIRQDPFIMTFLGVDDFRAYFNRILNKANTKYEATDGIFDNLIELKDEAINTMMKYLQKMLKFYTEFIEKLTNYRTEIKEYFQKRDQKIEIDTKEIISKFEPTDFIKKVFTQKRKLIKSGSLHLRKDYYTMINQNNGIMKTKINEDDTQNMELSEVKMKILDIVDTQLKHPKGMYVQSFDNSNHKSKISFVKVENNICPIVTHNDFLEKQRKKIREMYDDNKKDIDNEEIITKKQQMEKDINRLSHVNNSEISKMIQNSKILQKITILEKQQSIADGKHGLKLNPTENYVPLTLKSISSPTMKRVLQIKTDSKTMVKDQNEPMSPLRKEDFTNDKDNSIVLDHQNSNNNNNNQHNLDKKPKTESKSETKLKTTSKAHSLQKTNSTIMKKSLTTSQTYGSDMPKLKTLPSSTTNRISTNYTDNLPDINMMKFPKTAVNKIKNKLSADILEKMTNENVNNPNTILPTFFATTYNPDLFDVYDYNFDLPKPVYKSLLVKKTD